jgi:transcriptional regulator with XRE-family HTH domain
MSVGARIKKVRKLQKLNQRNFSQLLGLSQAHVSNIESDKDNPSDKLLRAICTNFNISFEWLKNGEGEMEDTSSTLDYTTVLIELKKHLCNDDEKNKLELYTILKMIIEINNKIGMSDMASYYSNFLEKLLQIFNESLDYSKEKKSVITSDYVSDRIEVVNNYNSEIRKILETMII